MVDIKSIAETADVIVNGQNTVMKLFMMKTELLTAIYLSTKKCEYGYYF
jgi:hypothetical protein